MSEDTQLAGTSTWDWLGYDLKLVEGDLSFGADGDLLAHTDPIESFADVLTHKSQVAANLVHDPLPDNISIAIRAGVNAIQTDPRIASVRITSGGWRVDDLGQEDVRFYVVNVTMVLASGDSLTNMVLPVYREDA